MVNLIRRFYGNKSKGRQKIFGIVLMATAGIFLALGNSLVQYIFDKNPGIHISSFQVLFIRSSIQFVLTGALMLQSNIHLYGGDKRNIWSLLLMGFLEASAIVLIYLSLKKIPIGEATVIHFTSPVFTMLFSFCLTRICCSPVDGFFGMLSFIGVVIIGRPSLIEGRKLVHYYHHAQIAGYIDARANSSGSVGNHIHAHVADHLSTDYAVGCGLALIATLCFAWFYILNKITGKNTDVALTILYPSIFGIVISPVAMLIRKENVVVGELKWTYWIIFLIVGCFGFAGMLFMGEAFQLDDPGPAVLIRNLDVVYTFVFQSLLLNKPPGLAAAVGTSIIISCVTVITLNRVFGLDRKLYSAIVGGHKDDSSDGRLESGSEVVPLLEHDGLNEDGDKTKSKQ